MRGAGFPQGRCRHGGVGEDTPGEEAYVDVADMRPPHVQSGVTVVLVLEDDEEVLWAVPRDLDVHV